MFVEYKRLVEEISELVLAMRLLLGKRRLRTQLTNKQSASWSCFQYCKDLPMSPRP